MLPKYHILYGAIFSLLLWIIYPVIGYGAFLVFLATFLIDVDHYFVYVKRKKNLSLKNAFNFFYKIHISLKPALRSGKKIKSPLVVLHTIEFLFPILILSFFFPFFLFILTGLLFHSLLDVIDMYKEFGTVYPRSFSTIYYFINRKKNSGKIKFL